MLAIGVGDYNEEHAKQLRLKFAAADASDVASALLNTQGSLYAKVNPQILSNEDANPRRDRSGPGMPGLHGTG